MALLTRLGRTALDALRGTGALGLVVGRTVLALPKLERRELGRVLV